MQKILHGEPGRSQHSEAQQSAFPGSKFQIVSFYVSQVGKSISIRRMYCVFDF